MLRRKSSKDLFRRSKFEENGMKERKDEVVCERGAEMSGEVIFML